MYIDPIHAGPVAHAMILAIRAHTQSDDLGRPVSTVGTPRRRRFKPLERLAQWWRQSDRVDSPTPDPVQLILWSECAGRHYVTAFGGLLAMNHLLKKLRGTRPTCVEPK
jgi:hypothetical protein